MTTTIEFIKRLREDTGAGLLDCRLAWEQSQGSYPQALAYLREKAEVEARKHADQETPQGAIEIYAHAGGRIAVMVEMQCESDFAARSETFRSLMHEVALQIAAATPLWVRDEDIPADLLQYEKEKTAARVREEGKPEPLIPRITEGYIKKFMDQRVLLRQTSIRDENCSMSQLLAQTSSSLGENVNIRRFMRWEFGENA